MLGKILKGVATVAEAIIDKQVEKDKPRAKKAKEVVEKVNKVGKIIKAVK